MMYLSLYHDFWCLVLHPCYYKLGMARNRMLNIFIVLFTSL
jgi:hypothetical protein